MKLRIGMWTVALGLSVQVVVGAIAMGASGIQAVLGTTAWLVTALAVAGICAHVAVIVGLIACAFADHRRWFAAAAITGIVSAFGEVLGGDPYWVVVSTSASVFCFAGATARHGARLAYALYFVAVVRVIVYLLPLHATRIDGIAIAAGFALQLLACVLAFHALAAFPEGGDAPVARIPSRARSGVTYASLAFCLCGIGLLAVALYQSNVAGAVLDNGLAFVGIGLFVGGVTALRRTRMQTTTVKGPLILIAVLFVVVVGLLPDFGVRPDEVELESHEVPGLHISLPAGRAEVETSIPGKLVVQPQHVLLGRTTLTWRAGLMPPMDAPDTRQVGKLAIVTRDVLHEGYLKSYAWWRCDDLRWFELVLMIREPNAFQADREKQFERLFSRVLATIVCTPG